MAMSSWRAPGIATACTSRRHAWRPPRRDRTISCAQRRAIPVPTSITPARSDSISRCWVLCCRRLRTQMRRCWAGRASRRSPPWRRCPSSRWAALRPPIFPSRSQTGRTASRCVAARGPLRFPRSHRPESDRRAGPLSRSPAPRRRERDTPRLPRRRNRSACIAPNRTGASARPPSTRHSRRNGDRRHCAASQVAERND